MENKKEEVLWAPLTGRVVPLSQVPDATFAEKMLGDGIAIEPTANLVVAPCDGVLTLVSDTKHALALTSDAGLEILIHVGLDTVEMAGEGFTQLVEAGRRVTAGTALLEVDFNLVAANGHPIITPMVITNMEGIELEYTQLSSCEAGKDMLLQVALV